jgi:mannose-6-phosphate isomerase-like protein (cupin superfamily)
MMMKMMTIDKKNPQVVVDNDAYENWDSLDDDIQLLEMNMMIKVVWQKHLEFVDVILAMIEGMMMMMDLYFVQ